ncbi:MAG: hypothetical protein CMJ64_11465 [Planctomycetaceae bacterium]|nr:hypothetical protein [Planctomycetaceae bacterium]
MVLSRLVKRFAYVACAIAVLSTLPNGLAQAQYYEPPRHKDDNDDGELGALLLLGGAVAAATPFWAPIVATGNDYSE